MAPHADTIRKQRSQQTFKPDVALRGVRTRLIKYECGECYHASAIDSLCPLAEDVHRAGNRGGNCDIPSPDAEETEHSRFLAVGLLR